jgi:hypothetical protein
MTPKVNVSKFFVLSVQTFAFAVSFSCGVFLLVYSNFLQTAIAAIQEIVNDPPVMPFDYNNMLNSIHAMDDLHLCMKAVGVISVSISLVILAHIICIVDSTTASKRTMHSIDNV